MLKSYFDKKLNEAGCDEAGRGCLAGPVYAAAVILPKKYRNKWLDDSKKLSDKDRYELRPEIEEKALSWAVGVVTHLEIDKINILNASFLAMHRAIDQLNVVPELLLIDGNRFNPYKKLVHKCIIGGDAKYMSIAAASILAKTYRDDFMKAAAEKHPQYSWEKNMGYATKLHRKAIREHGPCELHRMSFTLLPGQLNLTFD
ncbi:ribonuclease HII [Aurantibacillus circumpalustris]|uniref:ribonuclease HII n=1 Tax=Aurantibacillus circumpalustris TaxID=3036359 RepID=UPI00295B08F6|nr:ribonuclease HII [Aurantibacillus circumpalustris]